MKYKAKRLDNGEWVEGYFDGADKNYPAIRVEGIGDEFHLIDPDTLYQQVRGTEFFEGDEVKIYDDAVGAWIIGIIKYDGCCWDVVNSEGAYALDSDWKTTGRNIND